VGGLVQGLVCRMCTAFFLFVSFCCFFCFGGGFSLTVRRQCCAELDGRLALSFFWLLRRHGHGGLLEWLPEAPFARMASGFYIAAVIVIELLKYTICESQPSTNVQVVAWVSHHHGCVGIRKW
jgi:hypothetical protein